MGGEGGGCGLILSPTHAVCDGVLQLVVGKRKEKKKLETHSLSCFLLHLLFP